MTRSELARMAAVKTWVTAREAAAYMDLEVDTFKRKFARHIKCKEYSQKIRYYLRSDIDEMEFIGDYFD